MGKVKNSVATLRGGNPVCGACRIAGAYLILHEGQELCSRCLMDEVNVGDRADLGPMLGFSIRMRICAYCGDYGEDIEHVIPKASHLPTWTVRACHECNQIAGMRQFAGFRQKRAFIRKKLQHRYGHLLRMPEWTDDEIGELSDRLRTMIAAQALMAEFYRARMVFDVLQYGTVEEIELHGRDMPPVQKDLRPEAPSPEVLLGSVPDHDVDGAQPEKGTEDMPSLWDGHAAQSRRTPKVIGQVVGWV